MNVFDYLPADSPIEGYIVAMAALTAVVNAYLVYRVMLVRDPLAPRLKAMKLRRDALRADLSAPRRRAQRDRSIGMMKDVVDRLNLLKTREAKKASDRLLQAGYRSPDAVTIYFFLKLALPFAFGGTALFAVYVVQIVELEAMIRLLVCMGSVVIGAYGPELYLKNVISKRKALLRKGLPDALDLLVICAEAGQSLDGALTRVSRELGKSFPDISEELGLTAIELGLLPERREALENLNRRTDLPGIRGVVNTLLQTEKYGTPLAQSLRVLSAEFRNERMMKAEEKAARLPATMTVPMIIFILPPLFVVLIGPAVVRVIDLMKGF
jgi:tight adherence protein C